MACASSILMVKMDWNIIICSGGPIIGVTSYNPLHPPMVSTHVEWTVIFYKFLNFCNHQSHRILFSFVSDEPFCNCTAVRGWKEIYEFRKMSWSAHTHLGRTCQLDSGSCDLIRSSWCGSGAGYRTSPHHWPVHVAGTCEHGVAEQAAVGLVFSSLDRLWVLQEPPGLAEG